MASADRIWRDSSPASDPMLQQVMLVDPPTVAVHTSAATAVTQMAQAQVGCILILDQQRAVGIFTERDLVHLVAAQTSWEQPISALMVQPLICCATTEILNLLMIVERMQQHSVQYLPVVDAEERLVGLITQTLVLQALAEEHNRCRQAEAELRQQQERLSLLTDALPVYLSYLDAEQRYQFVNHTYEQRFGRSRDEICGRPIWDVLGDAAYQVVRPQIEQALAGTSVVYEAAQPDPQIGTRYTAVTLIPDRAADGQVRGCCALVTDITDRKQAELALQEREYLLRTLGDNLPKGLIYQFVHEPPDRYYFTYISAGIERLVGVKPEAVLQDPNVLHDLIVEADRQQMAELAEFSRQNLTLFEMQMRKRTPAGGIQWSQLRSAPRRLANGRTVWDGIELDITELKQFEAELQQAKVAAEAANRAKSIFWANVTHELRTPLNAILGFSQLLAQDDSLTDTQRQHIAIIHRSGEELLSLINRILDLSRLESQPWPPNFDKVASGFAATTASESLESLSVLFTESFGHPYRDCIKPSGYAAVDGTSDSSLDAPCKPSGQPLDSLSASPDSVADALLVMPLAWLEQLYRAAIQLDEKTLFALIQSLPAEHACLAQKLQLKVEEFEFEQIMQWSQQAIDQSSVG
ncbi:MAG: PAS domain S-box protein [Elainella sp. C42_A2020_010]|nr:PAS domain S-box protein [Elainella sp. C42_A2020_010]